jgi:RNA exonuclease 4
LIFSSFISAPPPKIKNLQKENISSNWKSLMSSTGIVPSGSNHQKPKPPPPRQQQKHNITPPTVSDKNNDDIWFDDVDEALLERRPPATGKSSTGTAVDAALVKERSFSGLTRIIGMDCEMVGVGPGGVDSILARVSIVNHFGHTVYDTFVAPREPVTDYRTHVSGVRAADLAGAPDFRTVQERVSELLTGRILVGHALKHDMRVLFLNHPKRMLRDTSTYKPFRSGDFFTLRIPATTARLYKCYIIFVLISGQF